MEFLIVFVVLVAVVLVVTAPLRRFDQRSSSSAAAAAPGVDSLAELEAAREAKFREIRDAELDHATGKLSDADHALVDGRLRAEAVEILRRVDELGERPSEGS